MHSLKILLPKSLKSVSPQGWFSLEALREFLLHPSFLAFGDRSSPWCSLACRHITTISASVSTWPSPVLLCPHSLPLTRTSVLGLKPTIPQYDLILMDYICKSPVSNKVILTGPGYTWVGWGGTLFSPLQVIFLMSQLFPQGGGSG